MSLKMENRTYKYANLLPTGWEPQIMEYLKEDMPSFDYCGFIVGDQIDEAVLLGKAKGIVAGVPFFNKIFESLDCKVTWILQEGDEIKPVQEVAIVKGPAKNILLGERTALNIMARCSGIATRAHALVSLAKEKGWNGRVAGTRKTTPGFRVVEKYGMIVGGADTHRYDLSSMIMLKDNVFYSAGSITAAVKASRAVGGFSIKIEVECSSIKDAEEAISAGADIVMLDNFTPANLHVAAAELKTKHPHILIEGSGGVTPDNIAGYFSPHVDVISLGSLTQGVPHIDFSLKIKKRNQSS